MRRHRLVAVLAAVVLALIGIAMAHADGVVVSNYHDCITLGPIQSCIDSHQNSILHTSSDGVTHFDLNDHSHVWLTYPGCSVRSGEAEHLNEKVDSTTGTIQVFTEHFSTVFDVDCTSLTLLCTFNYDVHYANGNQQVSKVSSGCTYS